ncbi:hypothetical protein KNP414_04508 [Paenibacillus mucilaginosus KNP414]|uniref:Uncharacterized protein n=1 Tax=Paenibacillus mucilaginosus (strain KNP414) TaxID=1036673 RepID=F8F9B0_PAEMK|nr:hypothetical protein KNP414_04508 [Paenibacillus mucilaginosus KNP414]
MTADSASVETPPSGWRAGRQGHDSGSFTTEQNKRDILPAAGGEGWTSLVD